MIFEMLECMPTSHFSYFLIHLSKGCDIMIDVTIFSGLLVIPVVIICFLMGYVIKNYTPIKNKNIPLIMMVLGVVINVVLTLTDKNTGLNLMTFVSGAVSGLASTGSYELIKNSMNISDTTRSTSNEISDEDDMKIDDNE